MKIQAVAGALLILALPQAAEARGGRISLGSSRPAMAAPKAVKPAAGPAAAASAAKPAAAGPAAASAAPSNSIWSSAPGAAAKPAAQTGGRSGGLFFVSTGGGSAAAKEQPPGQAQQQAQPRPPGAPLIQPASATAEESAPRGVAVPTLGQPQTQAQAARAPGFEVVR